jgi:hypothetical protein
MWEISPIVSNRIHFVAACKTLKNTFLLISSCHIQREIIVILHVYLPYPFAHITVGNHRINMYVYRLNVAISSLKSIIVYTLSPFKKHTFYTKNTPIWRAAVTTFPTIWASAQFAGWIHDFSRLLVIMTNVYMHVFILEYIDKKNNLQDEFIVLSDYLPL